MLISKKIVLLLLIISILLFLFSSCGQILNRPQESEENNSETTQKKDVPKPLSQLEDETEKIIEEIETIKKERSQMLREKETPSENSQEQSDNSEDDESPDTQTEENKTSNSPPLPTINWINFEETLENIHTLWNNLELIVRRDGASNNTVASFEDQLNTLTEQIMARNEDNTLVAANVLYRYYSKFMTLYKSNTPPELREVKYYARQSTIYGIENKWQEAKELLNDLDQSWQITKTKIDKPDNDLIQKIDFAIGDLKEAINKEKLELSKLKRDIVIERIGEL